MFCKESRFSKCEFLCDRKIFIFNTDVLNCYSGYCIIFAQIIKFESYD